MRLYWLARTHFLLARSLESNYFEICRCNAMTFNPKLHVPYIHYLKSDLSVASLSAN